MSALHHQLVTSKEKEESLTIENAQTMERFQLIKEELSHTQSNVEIMKDENKFQRRELSGLTDVNCRVNELMDQNEQCVEMLENALQDIEVWRQRYLQRDAEMQQIKMALGY